MRRLLRLAIVLSLVAPALAQQKSPRGQASAATYEISGVVIDSSRNQPIAHADVQILPSQGGNVLQRMMTAADGRFRFTELPAGKYQLIGDAHAHVRQGLDQHDGYFTGVVTGRGQVSTGITLRLNPEASITGRVADSFGDPVPDAEVMLFHRGLANGFVTTGYYADTRTDDQGEYRLGKLIGGTYFVAVTARPWYAMHTPSTGTGTQKSEELNVAYPTAFYDEVTQADGASPIVLHPGDEATANFTLNAVPATRIVLHTAEAAIGVSQKLFGGYENALREQVEERRIDEHTTELAGLPPGQFRVDVTTGGSSEGDSEPGSRTVNVDLRGDGPVDIGDVSALPPAHLLKGSVKENDAASAPQSLTVVLRDRISGNLESTGLQPDGTFSCCSNLPAGLYDVSLSGFEAYIDNVSATGAKVVGHSIQVEDAADVELTLAVKSDIAEVPGIVLDGKKPVAGTMVLLMSDEYPQDVSLMRRDQSDGDGTFTLLGVAPGRYTIMAIQGGWDLEWLNPEVIQPYLARGQHIEVAPKGAKEVKVKMQAVKKAGQ